MSRLLITSALPYANGPIHLGHLVEHVQTDIYARYRRLMGDEVLHLCADDAHGTGIELNARKLGITPEELVQRSWDEHTRDFAAFGIGFDLYYTTNSPENRELANRIHAALRDGGHIARRTTQQMYSESLERFLPDRWVKGTCPKCGAKDQYGDQCSVCNTTYEPTDLIEPYDAIEGKPPVLRETEHLYVRLSDFADFLREWIPQGVPQEGTRRFVDNWIEGGLEDWCISRDAPYFGFEIPGEPGKYFYVWLDAPIGYVAATRRWCADNGRDWLDWWGEDADAEIVHVIGKDIVYFHTLFWPAMLKAAGLRRPSRVQVHGFLTVNGEKMSKSRGTFVRASTWLEHLDASSLRFYIAAKLSSGIEDMDLSLDDFVNRVNADLVNNVVNLASRVTKFVGARFGGQVAAFEPGQYPICAVISDGLRRYRELMDAWDYRGAVRAIAEVGDAVNTYMQDAAPWVVIRDDPDEAARICAVALHGTTALMVALSPIVPELAARYAQAIGVPALRWEHASAFWRPSAVAAPDRLLERVELAKVEAMIEASKESGSLEGASADGVGSEAGAEAVALEPLKDEIEFDDFAKVDLRVGVVEEAAAVEGASKLLQLTVNIGRRINVFAGVRKAYSDPSVLVGRRVLVVANLKPRKMRFGISEGMLLAASGPDDEGLGLVLPEGELTPGWTVR